MELAYTGGAYMHLDTIGYFPLKASGHTHGLMAVSFKHDDLLALEEHHGLLEAIASLVAIVLERLR